MSYQLATSPDLYSVEKQQNVDEWKSVSMQAQTDRSMDGGSLHRGLENGCLQVGSRGRDPVRSGDNAQL